MRSLLVPARAGVTAPTRIICLPGAYQTPEEFLSNGFAEAVHRRGLCLDLLLVDVELRHLGDTDAISRLRDEAVEPARALGCRTVWLAGISLGGYLALDYAALHPGDLEGVCVLAPYLGNRLLMPPSGAAAPDAAPDPQAAGDGDVERRLWRFIRAPRTGPPRVHLGYGRDDRFAASHRLMAGHLADAAVDVVAGGHDWRTWTSLWDNFLNTTFT